MNETQFDNSVNECLLDMECIVSTLKVLDGAMEKGKVDDYDIRYILMFCWKSLISTIEQVDFLCNMKIKGLDPDDKV